MSRPVIGITASIEAMTSGDWTEVTVGTPYPYVRAVLQAGGRALVLPPDPEDAQAPEELLSMLDGLIVSGASADVDPTRYGQVADAGTKPGSAVRDDFDLALTRAALRRGLPLLGVCRGMQVLNVACGGSLVQHLPDVVDHDDHRGAPGEYSDHAVRLEPGSLAARAVGGEETEVRSAHHQGVADIGEGLRATAWSELDDIVEAVEAPGSPFALGVLWHPEEDERSQVIPALVDAARGRPGG